MGRHHHRTRLAARQHAHHDARQAAEAEAPHTHEDAAAGAASPSSTTETEQGSTTALTTTTGGGVVMDHPATTAPKPLNYYRLLPWLLALVYLLIVVYTFARDSTVPCVFTTPML